MERYSEMLKWYKEGMLTDAELISKVLDYFGDRPSSWHEVEAQLNKERIAMQNASLDADSEWLAETF